MGRGVYRSYYKGHKDKIKGEGRGGGGRWDWLGWGGDDKGGIETSVIVSTIKKNNFNEYIMIQLEDK